MSHLDDPSTTFSWPVICRGPVLARTDEATASVYVILAPFAFCYFSATPRTCPKSPGSVEASKTTRQSHKHASRRVLYAMVSDKWRFRRLRATESDRFWAIHRAENSGCIQSITVEWVSTAEWDLLQLGPPAEFSPRAFKHVQAAEAPPKLFACIISYCLYTTTGG